MATSFAYVPSTHDGCTVMQQPIQKVNLSDAQRGRRDASTIFYSFKDEVELDVITEDFMDHVGRNNESEVYWEAFSDKIDDLIDQYNG